MNLNEKCLLNFLQNPDELDLLTKVLEENINFLKDTVKDSVNHCTNPSHLMSQSVEGPLPPSFRSPFINAALNFRLHEN